jgi:hypothetical protein
MDELPCTAKPASSCERCSLKGPLMCRFEKGDLTQFLMIFLPFFVTAIGGVITAGYGWWLFGWLAYGIFFFYVWEARVLCSHCPYWAEDGRMLRCHANYGVIKLWKYRPGPMNRSEQVQFSIGALLLVLYPLLFMVIGQEYLLAAIGLVSAASFAYLLWQNSCDRCVNFSCPLNHVSPATRQAFLDRNPVIFVAWKAGSRSIR